MQRQAIELDEAEKAAFRKLKAHEPGVGFIFWGQVCQKRGLDAATVLAATNNGRVTGHSALPVGHGKVWCWPAGLVVPPSKPHR